MFHANSIIHCYGWRDVYESSFDPNVPDVIPPGKIVFCEACNIKEFFQALKNHPERKVVVLSCESDFGIVYQKDYPSNKDIFKAYYRIDWPDIEKMDKYVRLELKACEAQRCTFTDKFTAKIDGMTACTFNEIPDNVVKWFCANSCINEPRVEFLPFGVNSQGDLSLFEKHHHNYKFGKNKLLYVNFDVNTYDRFQLKNYWREQKNDWSTFVETAKPVEQFYTDIRQHDFILSAKGNGFSTYRDLESLYLGSIPICELNNCTSQMLQAGFPIALINNIYGLNKDLLEKMKVSVQNNLHRVNWNVLTKDYWFSKIHAAAKDI